MYVFIVIMMYIIPPETAVLGTMVNIHLMDSCLGIAMKAAEIARFSM